MKTLSIKHYALSIILALSLPASAQEKQVHTLTLEQVLRAIILRSANEASNGIAEYVSGNTEDFAKKNDRTSKRTGLQKHKFHHSQWSSQ